MTKSIDLLGIGNAIVDNLCRAEDRELERNELIKGSMTLVDEQTAARLESMVSPVSTQPGGSVANSVAHFAQLGGRCSFVGKVANDDAGDQYVEAMVQIGVDFRSARLDTGMATGRCNVFVTPDGQRTMCTYLGASVELSSADVDAETIAASKVVLIEGYLWSSPSAKDMILETVSIARQIETAVAFSLSDPFLVDAFRSELQSFVEDEVDLLFGNENEVSQLYSAPSLQDSVDRLKQVVSHIVVTRGENGSVAVVNNEMHEHRAAPVAEVVDTTGAGDAYAGGYLYGMAQGYPVARCMEIASDLAADVIGHFGGRRDSG